MLRSISFHPSGDFLLVGTQHPTLRLYDVNTFQCFVSCNPLDQHTDTISGVSYNPTANSYVTCSKDGNIKLWDGVSNRCVTTFEKAHDGAEVCSAVFSKNSKYILSSGKDSVVKLWEISTGRTLVKYTGKHDLCFIRITAWFGGVGVGGRGTSNQQNHNVIVENMFCFTVVGPSKNMVSLWWKIQLVMSQ